MNKRPQETTETVTAVKLLKATADRTKTPHHYIDLLKSTDAQINGNVAKYALAPVTDEKPGTYTVALRAPLKADAFQQVMTVLNVQVGTATVEKQIVEKEKCAACHLEADSGKFYFAHADPRTAGQSGSFSLDQNAVQNCKACHNNEGYSAYRDPADTNVRVPDQIVNRVHGVHNGEELSNPRNVDPVSGIFRDYATVVFPANIKNCAACHVDDRYKTKPSRLACGACHDQIDWTTGKSVVAGKNDHPGGAQTNDATCNACHQPDTKSVAPSIAEVHKVTPSASLTGATLNKIDFSLTPPANGKFYVAGEKPVPSLVIRDDNGNPIDHTKIADGTFSTASFFVYGPRYQSVPVLTNAARNADSKVSASVTNSIAASGTPKGWTFAAGDTFKIAVNGGAVQELAATAGLQTPEQVRDWLKANLKDVTVTANAAGTITLRSAVIGAPASRFEIYNSPVTTKMGWKPAGRPILRGTEQIGVTAGVTMEPYVVQASVSIPAVDLRQRSDPLNFTDPLVIRSTDKVTYQLDDVKGLKPGTYMVYSYVIPSGVTAGSLANPGPKGAPNDAAKALNVSREAVGFTTFQVGTETVDKKTATNCASCHVDTIWHLDEGPIHSAPFEPDYCKACHDYQRWSGTGDLFPTTGGNSTGGWAGYGAKPIGPRVHTIHFGRYVDHPEYGYAGNPGAFAEIIFPQDVRNCTKCHTAETDGTWKTNPNRLACSACHDSAKATAHMDLMTQNARPDPYGPNAVETCTVCHGAGKDFSPDKVHNISNPYTPPYPREKE